MIFVRKLITYNSTEISQVGVNELNHSTRKGLIGRVQGQEAIFFDFHYPAYSRDIYWNYW